MYAIIKDGGRQYKVAEGQEFEVDYRSAPAGSEVQFDTVLAISQGESLRCGQPTLSGAKVSAEVLAVTQGPKLTVQKFRRRKNMRRKNGHRQMFTKVRVTKISG
ncbi:MAG: 50S ribosomal protein L21 [Planctomycetaceae bacterium]|nr:50S ribosomal protein L21 [Planctomycetaceae bacterium]